MLSRKLRSVVVATGFLGFVALLGLMIGLTIVSVFSTGAAAQTSAQVVPPQAGHLAFDVD